MKMKWRSGLKFSRQEKRKKTKSDNTNPVLMQQQIIWGIFIKTPASFIGYSGVIHQTKFLLVPPVQNLVASLDSRTCPPHARLSF